MGSLAMPLRPQRIIHSHPYVFIKDSATIDTAPAVVLKDPRAVAHSRDRGSQNANRGFLLMGQSLKGRSWGRALGPLTANHTNRMDSGLARIPGCDVILSCMWSSIPSPWESQGLTRTSCWQDGITYSTAMQTRMGEETKLPHLPPHPNKG